MKKYVLALAAVAVFATFAMPSADARDVHIQAQVNLAPLGRSYSPPPLGRKQGWLTVSNRDWQSYSVVITGKDKIYLYRDGDGYGGMVIPSGATVTIALEKETYDLYGNNPDKLKVKIREGRTTTLSLEPFGYVGNTGVRGIVNDGDKVRDEILFDAYTAPIVVAPQPPAVIINRPPPPPPVIISRPPPSSHRPPPSYGHGRPGRPGGHRPPPPPPPRPGHHDKKDGWGFVFGFGKN